WLADMDFPAAPCIQEVLKKRIEHGICGYNYRSDAFFEAVQGWASKRYGWEIERDWIIHTPGVVPAINLAVLALTQPKDKVLIQTPVYRPFFNAVEDHDRCLLTNPLINDNGYYRIDRKDFEAKIRQASLFILCNPHNPVGRVFTTEELSFMADLCKRYNVPVLSDEIHADIIYDNLPFRGLGSMKSYEDVLITCMSPSKSFNIAGLCTALTIIPNPKIRKQIDDLNTRLHLFGGNTFGIIALQAAYTCAEPWLTAMIQYLDGNRKYVKSYIDERLPMLKVNLPEGGFLSWIDFSGLGMNDNDLFDFLTNKARVALDPGRKFGVDGSGFSRLNFACPRSCLEEAMRRLNLAIQTC
ncbi:MAG TPA: MalY/PatB family protein, partial [Candidatus Cloacimonadota bacterium]|nr:MalY/PatB family protein [Candidatus Cloacimonadota bacterium]